MNTVDPPHWETAQFSDFSEHGVDDDITLSSSTKINYDVCKKNGESDYAFFWNNTEPIATTTTTYNDNSTDNNNSNQYGWITSCIFWLHTISFVIMLCMACAVRKAPEDISDSRRVCHALCANCCCLSSLGIIWLFGYVFQNLGIMASSRGLMKSFQVYTYIGYLIFPKIYAVCYEKKYGYLPPPRQPRRHSRNKKSSTVVGGRGETRINGVTLPAQQQPAAAVAAVIPKKKNRWTLAISEFSIVNNDDDDDDDDDDGKNNTTGNNGWDTTVNSGDVDDGDGDAVATIISGINGGQQQKENTGKSLSSILILEEINNRSSSFSPSLKDSDAVASIVLDNRMPSKMEYDNDDECNNNNINNAAVGDEEN